MDLIVGEKKIDISRITIIHINNRMNCMLFYIVCKISGYQSLKTNSKLITSRFLCCMLLATDTLTAAAYHKQQTHLQLMQDVSNRHIDRCCMLLATDTLTTAAGC